MGAEHTETAFAGNALTGSMEREKKKSNKRVPQEVIDTLLEKVSLLDLIKESTPVRIIGKQHKAHCPFHIRGNTDSTLSIDGDEQKFTCSICEFHGSAIGWLMFHDGLSFQDSIYELANRSNVDVAEWITPESIESSRIKKRSLLKDVEEFYRDQLALSDEARKYTHDRGLTEDTLQRFGIGFAPGDDETLESAFPKMSRNLWNEGLLVRLSDEKFGKRFRDRLMFPIRDSEGHTVGFGGRALGDSQPKYLNSPSSPTFNKSNLLYGFFESTQDSIDPDRFILVEGYIDVLTLHQFGFGGAVATLGTAPSEYHIKTVFSRSEYLIACFDGDSAGLKAAERLLLAALPHLLDNQRLCFALLPPGQDPDSLLRDQGKKGFESVLDAAMSLEDFLHETLSRSLDLSGIGGKAQLAALAQPIVEIISSNKLRESTIKQIESTIGIPWFDRTSRADCG